MEISFLLFLNHQAWSVPFIVYLFLLFFSLKIERELLNMFSLFKNCISKNKYINKGTLHAWWANHSSSLHCAAWLLLDVIKLCLKKPPAKQPIIGRLKSLGQQKAKSWLILWCLETKNKSHAKSLAKLCLHHKSAAWKHTADGSIIIALSSRKTTQWLLIQRLLRCPRKRFHPPHRDTLKAPKQSNSVWPKISIHQTRWVANAQDNN